MAVCYTADEAGAAFDAFMVDEVEATVSAETQEAVRLTYYYLVTLRTTWSPQQAGEIWTGQFRYSTNVSIGSPDLSYLPTMEGQPWPHANAQYGISDVISGPEVVGSVQFGDVVYLTNSSPHAGDVESHTGIFATAAELASRDLASTDFSSVVSGNTIPF